jgi:hypothetical protein
MNVPRLLLAALGGLLAQFAVGFALLGAMPGLLDEAREHSAVFRPEAEMMKLMPIGIAASFLAILVAAFLFAQTRRIASGAKEGARFGAVLGLFVVFAFVLHNYANLNLGLKLSLLQAVAYFVQWTAIGIVIGLIYEPAATQPS